MLGSKLLLHLTLTMKKKLLLHSCCGPCSTAVIERLLPEYAVTVFYYNPNIHPEAEYTHRKAEQQRVCKSYGVEYIEGDYIPEDFFASVKGLEEEPEGGKRCRECFLLRMRRTAFLAKEKGFDLFDTTLSVSPHKNYDVISEVGRLLEEETGIAYLSGNYKKQNGYKRSVDLSRELELYRQNYCGCVFSDWTKEKK